MENRVGLVNDIGRLDSERWVTPRNLDRRSRCLLSDNWFKAKAENSTWHLLLCWRCGAIPSARVFPNHYRAFRLLESLLLFDFFCFFLNFDFSDYRDHPASEEPLGWARYSNNAFFSTSKALFVTVSAADGMVSYVEDDWVRSTGRNSDASSIFYLLTRSSIATF